MGRGWCPAAAMAAVLLWTGLASAATCRDEAGAARAAIYVRQCLAITSATHPPCNAENSCADIGKHIQYMCARDPNPPAWCAAYKNDPVPNPPPQIEVTEKPGFDCAKATTPVEHAICGSSALAKDDREMTEDYLHLLAKTADKAGLRAGQREFDGEREHCGTPESGRAPDDVALTHCIDELTTLRTEELRRLAGAATDSPWNADGPDPCEAYFGGDGSDQIQVLPTAGKTQFVWVDLREAVVKPSDTVTFDVDGAVFPGHIEADSDGQANAVTTDPKVIEALGRGRWLRVRRNGKVIFRAALAGFPASYADAEKLCAKAPEK